MQIFKKLVWLGFTCTLFYAPVLLAQQDEVEQNSPGNEAVTEDIEFHDNLGRDTPRSSFAGFLHFTEAFDYASAVDYIDLRNLPHAVRKIDNKELARQLDFVIKRGMQIELTLLSPRPNGQVVDGLPEYRDELGHVATIDGDITLYLQQVPGVGGQFIWKTSNASIALIPGLY